MTYDSRASIIEQFNITYYALSVYNYNLSIFEITTMALATFPILAKQQKYLLLKEQLTFYLRRHT